MRYPPFPDGVSVSGHIGLKPRVGAQADEVLFISLHYFRKKIHVFFYIFFLQGWRLSPFFGQMATIYFFDDLITPAQVLNFLLFMVMLGLILIFFTQAKGFFDLGPHYSSCFQRFPLSSFFFSFILHSFHSI